MNNKPISTLNVFGNLYTDLNFTYDLIGEGQNEDGYIFIKSNNINDTNYTYFFETVNATINYKKNNENDDGDDNITVLMAVIYSVIGLVIVALVIVLIILYKSGKCSRKKEEENPNSISILNRDSEIK